MQAIAKATVEGVVGKYHWIGVVFECFVLTLVYSDESDESDDDEDNTAELLATLQKIRRERAEEKERQERERLEQEEAEREEEAMTGNPLLNIGDEKRDFSVKRR